MTDEEFERLLDEILDYRATHRISQLEFAKLVGVSEQTMSYISNGKKPSKITIRKINNVIKNKNKI